MLLKDLIDQYLAASPEIRGTQRGLLLRMRGDSIGNRHAQKLMPMHVIAWMKERNLTVAPSTAAMDLGYLRSALDYAKQGLGIEGVSKTPINDAMPILRRQRLIGSSETRTRIPTADETANILALLRQKDPRNLNAEVIEFQYESGRRIGESCRMIWPNLDKVNRTILICDLKHPRKKAGHNKRAALPDAAFEIIMRQDRLTNSPDERIFKAEASTVGDAYRRSCKTLGIDGLHLHDSRARVVTHLLDQGYTEPQIMLVTLHDTARMIRARYNRLQANDFPRRAQC